MIRGEQVDFVRPREKNKHVLENLDQKIAMTGGRVVERDEGNPLK